MHDGLLYRSPLVFFYTMNLEFPKCTRSGDPLDPCGSASARLHYHEPRHCTCTCNSLAHGAYRAYRASRESTNQSLISHPPLEGPVMPAHSLHTCHCTTCPSMHALHGPKQRRPKQRSNMTNCHHDTTAAFRIILGSSQHALAVSDPWIRCFFFFSFGRLPRGTLHFNGCLGPRPNGPFLSFKTSNGPRRPRRPRVGRQPACLPEAESPPGAHPTFFFFFFFLFPFFPLLESNRMRGCLARGFSKGDRRRPHPEKSTHA